MSLKTAVLAWMFGFMALAAAFGDVGPRFIRGALERGHPAVEEDFIGIEWRCGRKTCWAGNVILLGDGPHLAHGRYR